MSRSITPALLFLLAGCAGVQSPLPQNAIAATPTAQLAAPPPGTGGERARPTAARHEVARSAEAALAGLLLLDGAVIDYVEQGRGSTVILVHANLTEVIPTELQAQIALLSEHHHVVAYTSRRPPTMQAFGVEVQELGDLILRLGTGPVHLLGHSYGVFTALQFALDHPQQVRSLVLTEPAPLALLSQLVTGTEPTGPTMGNVWEPYEEEVTGVGGEWVDLRRRLHPHLPPLTGESAWEEACNADEWRALEAAAEARRAPALGRARGLSVPTLHVSLPVEAGAAAAELLAFLGRH
jgi:non-heme chloroperoxidase